MAGGLVALALAMGRGETGILQDDIVWASLAGLVGPAALILFYRALAVGRMGTVAPIAGVLGAAVPAVVGGVLEGLPGPLQVVGIGLALGSVVLVTRSSAGSGAGTAGIALAVGAGLGFGAFFLFLGRVGPDTVFAPLVLVRLIATVLIGTMAVLGRGSWRLHRSAYVPVVIAGVLDMGGNLWYLLAVQQGRLDIAAVLASLYPVVTIVLAAAILKERIGVVQAIGILAALGAIVLIAAG